MNKIERILSLAIICILPILPSCLPTIYTPEYNMLRKIENMPYLNNKFNCVDKAILYHRHLQKNGIESRVVSGRIDGHKVHQSWVEAYSTPNDRLFKTLIATFSANGFSTFLIMAAAFSSFTPCGSE